MSFPAFHLNRHKQTINNYPKQYKMRKGKEKDLHLALPPIPNKPHQISERASAFTSGSITVETALVLPIFFLALICIIYLLEIMAVQTAVHSGLLYAGGNQAEKMYPVPYLRLQNLEEDVISGIGRERLDQSIIVDGSSGLHLEQSFVSGITGIMEIKVKYQVRLPIPMFISGGLSYEDSVRVKGWNGYVKSFFTNSQEETVYITETGMVYHKDYKCTHLDLSIRMVPFESVADLRNQSQGKYYPCERCGALESKEVYLTDNGNRYHSQIGCSGLKRSIFAVPLSEVRGRRACLRCGQ